MTAEERAREAFTSRVELPHIPSGDGSILNHSDLPRSPRSVEDSLALETDEFLKAYDLTEEEIRSFDPLVKRFGVYDAMSLIAFSKVVGTDATGISQFLISRDGEFLDRAHLDKFIGSNFWRATQDKDSPVALQFGDGQKIIVRAFPFSISVYPEAFLGKTNSEGFVLAMHLPKSEADKIYGDLEKLPQEAFPSAVAHIRFARYLRSFSIDEISGGSLAEVRSAELKDRYGDWEKCLLAAFEEYIYFFEDQYGLMNAMTPERLQDPSALPTLGNARASYVLPGLDYMLNHRTAAASMASLERLEEIYETVPREIGLTPLSTGDPSAMADPLFREVKRSDVSDGASFFCGLVQRVEEGKRIHPELFGRDDCDEVELGFFLDEAFDSRFPREIYLDGERDGIYTGGVRPLLRETSERVAVSPLLQEHFETAPVIPVDPEGIVGVTRNGLKVRNEALRSEGVLEVARCIEPLSSPISRGVVTPVDGEWWKIGSGDPNSLSVRGLHIVDQDRHPSLRFTVHDEEGSPTSMLALGCKGAGLRTFEESQVITWSSVDKELKRPFYLRDKKATPDFDIPSHAIWGGLMRWMATVEYSTSLSVLEVDRETAPDQKPATVIPVDVVLPHRVPLFPDEGPTEWYSQHDYERHHLDQYHLPVHQRLAIFRSLSPCDVRLSQIANRIFDVDKTNPESHGDKIRESLNFLYWVNGEEARFSSQELPSNPGMGEVLQYLHSVGEENREAATRISNHFSHQLLRIIAAVHGAGGHLGGGRFDDVGAVGGGAPTIRNIDAAAVIHDLDPDVFIPWSYNSEATNLGFAQQREALLRMQWYDLLYFKESMHWVDGLLFGRENHPNESFEYEFGKSNTVTFLEPTSFEMMLLSTPSRKPGENLAEMLKHIDSENHDLYSHYFKRGQGIA